MEVKIDQHSLEATREGERERERERERGKKLRFCVKERRTERKTSVSTITGIYFICPPSTFIARNYALYSADDASQAYT